MSEITRRDALRRIGIVLVTTGVIDRLAGEEVHAFVQQAAAGGAYAPQALSPHAYATLERLTDLIIPVENGKPGAKAAGAAAWIDSMASVNERLQTIYRDGLAWLDTTLKARGQQDFLSAPESAQTALLDRIAYRGNSSPELDPGIEFFGWARRMTVDAFYTSEIGIKDIDYRGNQMLSSYPEPTEAIAYALKKSGL